MTPDAPGALERQGGRSWPPFRADLLRDRERRATPRWMDIDSNRSPELRWAEAGVRSRALGASILSGIVFGSRASITPAQAPTMCIQDGDCLAGAPEPCSGARCDGGFCTYFIVSCIPGYVCCGNGECCPAASCLSDADCAGADANPCTVARCDHGTCVPYILTCAPGIVCCAGACAQSCPAALPHPPFPPEVPLPPAPWT